MATFNVSNSAQLATALNQASGGDKIVLASGDYGRLEINEKFSTPLTITSADAGNPASFSTMSIRGAENVTLDHVVFDYKFNASDVATYKPFEVVSCANVVIQNSVFDGDKASGLGANYNGYGYAVGLSVRSSSNMTIENNEFKSWGSALMVKETQNINVSGNDINTSRKDGMNFVEVKDVLIANNYIHDFKGLPDWTDHRDMIQFWTAGTNNPSSNITIRKNVLDIGDGSHTQSIFMRNEVVDKGQAGQSMFYQNVLIENNTIINHHLHGITVGETEGLVIQNNTLVAAVPDSSLLSTQYLLNKYGPSAGILIPRINVVDDAHNVNIKDNAFYGGSYFTGDRVDAGTGSDWHVTGNVSHPTDAGPQPGSGGNGSGGGTGAGGSGGGTGGNGSGGLDGGGGNHPPVLDDYVTKFASLVGTTAMKGNAFVQNGVLHLDGKGDFVNLGNPAKFDASDDLSFSIDYSRDVANGSQARLVWNQDKLGLVLKGDGLFIKVAGEDGKFKLFSSGNLGLNDTEHHNVRVIVDSATDHLQVIVDGKIAIDRSDIDLDIGHVTGHDWLLGGAKWGTGLDGEISNFRLEADTQFFDDASGVFHHDAAVS